MADLVFRSALVDLLRTKADEIAGRVAQRLEDRQVAEPIMSIVGARRTKAMVAQVIRLVLEALEGGADVRQIFLEMIVPTSAEAADTSVIVHESYRVWMYLLTEMVRRLPDDFQGPASAWLSDFITDWMRTIEVQLFQAKSRASPPGAKP
ncbi:MAG: hypothetical protein AAGF11_10545 [Myxococcota bacterium]